MTLSAANLEVRREAFEEALALVKTIETFEDYKKIAYEAFRQAITRADVDRAKEIILAHREHLLKTNPKFAAELAEHRGKMRMNISQARAEAQVNEREAELTAQQKTSKYAMMADLNGGESPEAWAKRHQITKKRTFEEAEKEAHIKLICPICFGPDHNNIVNGVPTCTKCWHKLVPQTDLKKYNRDYRRRWKRKKNKPFGRTNKRRKRKWLH
jgi:ribosomal protein L37AE/L43A